MVEFAQQTARLRIRPSVTVSDHDLFALHEYRMRGLPGTRLNVSDTDDEIWLAVSRLHETKPPDVKTDALRPWVQMTLTPNEEPKLFQSIDAGNLTAQTSHPSAAPGKQGQPTRNAPASHALADYENADQVRAQFAAYVEAEWRPWAVEEKLRRETIRLYAQLFTLKQQLDGGMAQSALEIVWGVGIGVWRCDGTTVGYPLVTRGVELSLNAKSSELEIRPRDVDARLEIDWYASVGNPGVANLEKAAKDFWATATTTFSPFDRGTFEPLLRTAVANLDGNGMYWPNEVPVTDRTLPKPDDKLKVTDTWVLFARPRTNSIFVEDLEQLKKRAEEVESYPPAVAAVVSDPETTNDVIELPHFRGVSVTCHGENTRETQARHLYFPKPFNDEQVRIIQLLDVFDGVVVQGPPGTGKTHTIANVICHYLAEGKRVLVTSMKDPALAVLRDQLPAEIRPLAISLLTTEPDGMKQFEHAIHKIASEVQGLDRSATARAINHLDISIDALHGKLSGIDWQIGDWAKKNLATITLEDEEIAPRDAAQQVVESAGEFEWISDKLGIDPAFSPQFSDTDLVRLRTARRMLANDIDYLGASIPQLVEFPDSKSLLELHQDISTFEKLNQSIENGDVPRLADSSHEVLALAQELLVHIETLDHAREEILQAQEPWVASMRERLRDLSYADLLLMFEELGSELTEVVEHRKAFLKRPVITPADIELDADLTVAVANLAQGKRPFGLKGLFGKSERKKQLGAIRVFGSPVADSESWRFVAECLALLRRQRELAMRWNALASELNLQAEVSETPDGALAAAHGYFLSIKLRSVIDREGEICRLAASVFPNWPHARAVGNDTQRLSDLKVALLHHLTKNRLANVWTNKERWNKLLECRSGRIVDNLRDFFVGVLGNTAVTDAAMQAKWSSLMAELSRVSGLGTQLAAVSEVCGKIEASGAPTYAAALRQPTVGAVDTLLPDNLRAAWRLKRLSTYLESIDAQQELKKLARTRQEIEADLARAYRDVVVKRTWLKLAENASPSIRAALQAYLNAIQKIGKGNGKRAVRYRHDARVAAQQANPAVPCWIMAHYRVSESLPPELGCFDLVIIDEASQSDLTALPSLSRARKVLIVGDDKQVSPDAVGLEEDKVRGLMNRFLAGQVDIYRQQMSPERSIYDLFKVVFARSSVMLREHFRCVGPVIEYSKREFYNHELRPLRLPRSSERLDPPLIDVLVQDGYREGDINVAEARFIVDEIKTIASDPIMASRSIGVVCLLADKQAMRIWDLLTDEIGLELIQRHQIECGDARTFQGKERDIMFLSMVAAPNRVGAPLARSTFAQSFNVAASRARDRMYLVRSVGPEHLSNADVFRRSLIEHFAVPFAQDEVRVDDLRKLCESPFEREMYDELTQRGYRVTPQVRVGQFRIDMVVEGHNDSRLAVECDGDQYHGLEKWADDMQRQRVLERAGWIFWRCFASTFVRRRRDTINDLLKSLADHGIEPIGSEGAPRSVHTEHRVVSSFHSPTKPQADATEG